MKQHPFLDPHTIFVDYYNYYAVDVNNEKKKKKKIFDDIVVDSNSTMSSISEVAMNVISVSSFEKFHLLFRLLQFHL